MAEVDRLRFALVHLTPTDWQAFEQLASTYLASDLPELRTIAGIGDEGRDAVLEAADQPQIIVQYSIVDGWRQKILDTLDDLAKAKHPCSGLIYATNQDIGPRAQNLKSELFRKGIMLDVRDRSFFLNQIDRFPANGAAAQALSDRVVTPLLPVDEVVRNSSVVDPDLRAGLLYLELWLHDTDANRNISRLSYDSLVLSVLRDTDSSQRRKRREIPDAVKRLLPGRAAVTVESSVDGALQRLRTKRRITVTGDSDAFALHNDERQARTDRALRVLAERDAVRAQLATLTKSSAAELEIPYPEGGSEAFIDTLEQLFERTLEQQGNRFAEAVRQQAGIQLRHDVRATAEDAVTRNARRLRSIHVPRAPLVELATEVATNAFLVSGPLRAYLRELADAYTLLAFMQEAPDVQRAVSQLFSRGRLVLDTSVLLPCIPESMLREPDQQYTNLLRGAREAGIALCTTEGVLNELNAHLDLCLLYHRMPRDEWRGSVPMVYERWFEHTRGGDFPAFIGRFRGDGGIEDIQLFLDQALGIDVVEMASATDLTDRGQRYAVTEIWRPRKHMRPTGSEIERDIRVRHDIEMYFGVLAWRRGERRDLYGYEAWWVTADSTALRMFDLAGEEDVQLDSNPAMSPTFFANLLTIGPSRARLARDVRDQLPVALDIQRDGFGIAGLSGLADDIRAEHANEPEWLIRRRIRDRMNELKQLDKELGVPLIEIAEAE